MSGDENEQSTENKEPGVITNVRRWLDEMGYRLEMKVARAFQSMGADVIQSDYYETPEGKFREIDVSANFRNLWHGTYEGDDVANTEPRKRDAPRIYFCDLLVVTECKSTPKNKKPWVVFTSDRSAIPAMVRFDRLGSRVGKHALQHYWSSKQPFARARLFALPERVGYSLACVRGGSTPDKDGKDNYDQAYSALTGLVQAARARTAVPPPSIAHHVRLVLPLLVVDSPIVECWLDDQHQTQLAERKRMTLVWRNPVGGDAHATIIDVVHVDSLDEYVSDVQQVAAAMADHSIEVERSQIDLEAEDALIAANRAALSKR